MKRLFADLADLPDRLRGALLMRELSGLGYEDIATALSTTGNGAKQAVYDARVALHDFERGREMSCEEVMRQISTRDGRLLRGRQVRAHLRGCGECRSFREALGTRSTDLAALAPPLPAAAAAAMLQGVIGGGGGGGPLAALTGWAGKLAVGPALAKGLTAGVITAAVGVGAVDLATGGRERATPPGASSEADVVPAGSTGDQGGSDVSGKGRSAGDRSGARRRGDRGSSPSDANRNAAGTGPTPAPGATPSPGTAGGPSPWTGGPAVDGRGSGEQRAQGRSPGDLPPAAPEQIPSGSPQGDVGSRPDGSPRPDGPAEPVVPKPPVSPPAGRG